MNFNKIINYNLEQDTALNIILRAILQEAGTTIWESFSIILKKYNTKKIEKAKREVL